MQQQQGQPFHGAMQTELASGVKQRLGFAKADCTMSILRAWFLSVRSWGLRSDKPRQGRNAATAGPAISWRHANRTRQWCQTAAGFCESRLHDVDLARMVPFRQRSEEHTSELQSRVDISYAVFCLKKKT